MKRLVTLVLSALVALTLVACGGAKAPAEKAFGDLTDKDRTAAREFVPIVGDEWPRSVGRIVAAESANNLAGMRAGVDDLAGVVQKADSIVLDFDNSAMRSDFADEVSGLRRVTQALDQYISYLEDQTTAADATAQAALAKEITDAIAQLQQADRKVTDRILDATPVGERDAFREQIRAAKAQSEALAQGNSTP